MMLHLLSEKIALFLFDKNDKYPLEIYTYGFELIVSSLIEALSILILGILIGNFTETLIFIVYFSLIRFYSGGYHAYAYMKCYLITVIVYATSGSVYVGGQLLGKDITFPPSIGIMLENPAFLNGYSGYDNLRMLADIRSEIDEDRICEVMRLVGLEENGRKKYRKFSLGMKQRLGIAAAFMERPQILLLDEPTNSLDENGIQMVRKIINMEKEQGATVVISCHDARILESLSDEIIQIQNGRITKIYTPKKDEE